MQGWIVVIAAMIYIGFLFVVATWGDRLAARGLLRAGRPSIYALSLCVYCTSWTFFGSVGLSAASGLDFLPVYLGAALMIGAGYPIVLRVVRLAKSQNITSIADFIASRYGKNQAIAALVAVIAVVGAVPYISLQLKAVSNSVTTMVGYLQKGEQLASMPIFADLALLIALALALFAILFGTRHVDATEHQDGMMLAVATESVVKLAAFLVVGTFVTWSMFDGFSDLWQRAADDGVLDRFTGNLNGGTWLTITFLSFVCIILLPRQFHVAVVENNSEEEVRRAAWAFPAYLVLINLFVVPIAIAGLLTFPAGGIDADMFVLSLPMAAGSNWVTLIAFIGGLSAATAMVIVAAVALAIMICNDIVVPLVLRHSRENSPWRRQIGRLLLPIRRIAIMAVLLLAYAYYRAAADTAALASIGLLAFSAVAQLSPSFFGSLIWRRATAKGAGAGMAVGFAVWFYTLLLPTFAASGLISSSFVETGPFGLTFLRPQQLLHLSFDPLTHGVFWSVSLNLLFYIIVSLATRREPIERLQANVFVQSEFVPIAPPRLWRSSVTIGELKETLSRYIGTKRTARTFNSYAADRRIELRRRCRSRHACGPPRRARAGQRHRRLVVTARAVAPAQGPRRQPEPGHEAARRCDRGDPVQPRSAAVRAQPCAPGHRGV